MLRYFARPHHYRAAGSVLTVKLDQQGGKATQPTDLKMLNCFDGGYPEDFVTQRQKTAK